LQRFARLIRPHLARFDTALARCLKSARESGPRQLEALLRITPGADFFEQLAYSSRRLAKLNVPPLQVLETLRQNVRHLDAPLAEKFPRQQLHFRSLLTVNNAYYQVREAETQAFYGLLRAEMDATGLDDLLHRFILILTRTFRARSGRLFPLPDPPPIAARALKQLARPRYIAAGTPAEKLILDPQMRGAHQAYWSIPFFSAGRITGLIQFGFPKPYRWLPRELDLLQVFAERCLRAAERTRLLQDLAASEAQVRSLAGRLLDAEEEQRRRLGRELHDEAGQSMVFLRLHLEMLEKTAPPGIRPRVAEARAATERIIHEIRRIVAALAPSAVEELGLPAAIRRLSARFRKLYPVKLRLRLAPSRARLSRETENAIYRAVQECYQNIANHSAASRVNLSLRSTDKQVELTVTDNGIGFDAGAAAARPKSFGLKGMRERVALLGGHLEIRGSPGKGTVISMQLPVPPNAA